MSKKEKSEVANLPGYEVLGETQKSLIDSLLEGFKDMKEFLEWKRKLIHSSFGNEDATAEIIGITADLMSGIYLGKSPHQAWARTKIANYLIVKIFPIPQRFFSYRAREDPSSQKKGMFKEEADPFEGGLS